MTTSSGSCEHGAQVRTLDEFFNRLIVIDRRLAVIPGEATDVAVAIHDPNLVSYLADIFDRSWERGRGVRRARAASESDIAAEVRQLTVRMLTEGHSDPASAKRVGVSTRTYASYVAALKDEYGVETASSWASRWGAGTRSQPPRADPDSASYVGAREPDLKPQPVSVGGCRRGCRQRPQRWRRHRR